MKTPVLIGIAGGTGSGKTTLVKELLSCFEDHVITISHDDYYKANKELSIDERKRQNYDHPCAFDTDEMIEHLKVLKAGLNVEKPIYSFVKHTREEQTQTIEPKDVIIVDGILIFENKDLRDLLDIKIYVDTDADVRIIRRILRDVKERGRDLDSVINQYLTTVKLMHEQFVEPSKKYADVIIPEGGFNKVAISMLVDKIRALLDKPE